MENSEEYTFPIEFQKEPLFISLSQFIELGIYSRFTVIGNFSEKLEALTFLNLMICSKFDYLKTLEMRKIFGFFLYKETVQNWEMKNIVYNPNSAILLDDSNLKV